MLVIRCHGQHTPLGKCDGRAGRGRVRLWSAAAAVYGNFDALLDHFPSISQPTRAMCSALLSVQFYRMLIGACDPMPLHAFRPRAIRTQLEVQDRGEHGHDRVPVAAVLCPVRRLLTGPGRPTRLTHLV